MYQNSLFDWHSFSIIKFLIKLPISLIYLKRVLKRDKMSNQKVHTTIGIYPNGDFKTNGVSTEHLQTHIDYNLTYRPGRALVVDNKIIYNGQVSQSVIDEVIKKNQNLKYSQSTAPHH